MDAKYIITRAGKVAIFSKYLGMEHIEVSHLLDAYDPSIELEGAGFCSIVADRILTYGRSTSTGVAANPHDASVLTQLLHDGKLTMVFLEAKLGYIATNAPDMIEHFQEMPCTIESMAKAKIFK